MLEMKNKLDGTNGRFNIAEEKIREYEDAARTHKTRNKKKKTENQCVWEKFIKCKEVYPWDIPMGKGKKDIWRNNS